MNQTRRRRRPNLEAVIAIIVGLFVLVALWPYVTVSIKPGEVGVLYSRLFGGTVRDRTYDEGIHFILPWDIMYVYDARVREEGTEIQILSREGLAIEVSASIRYRIVRSQVTELHVNYGPAYERVLIRPVFLSSIREAIGQYRPEELYSTAPEEIQEKATIEAVHELNRLPVEVDAIIFKWVRLPAGLSTTIEEKLREEQQVLKYQFILERTYKEAIRRVVEGEGIRLYQQAINEGLSENFLRFKGIEATQALAASDNAKIVVVGGKDGLPLILNPDGGGAGLSKSASAEQAGPPAAPDDGLPRSRPHSLPAEHAESAVETLDERIARFSDRLHGLWDSVVSARIPAKVIVSPTEEGRP